MKPSLFKKLMLIAAFPALSACSTFPHSCAPKDIHINSVNGDLIVTQYSPASPTQKGLILVPPTGGTNVIDRSYAKSFCSRGYDTYIINDWPRPNEQTSDLELHQHFYENAQKAIEAVMHQMTSSFIGILGTSVGALHASIAANTMERLNAAFFIVGGLPIAEVVVTSDQLAMRNLRDLRKERFGFKNDQQNIDAIEKVFSLEPERKSPNSTKDFGAVVATEDSTVPTVTQQKLVDHFKPSVLITIHNGHFWTVIKTWLFHSDEIIDFFDKSSNDRLSRIPRS